jgi:catechol 2,3-dioxygenase-like lactoylglutathione lyase family enzyme
MALEVTRVGTILAVSDFERSLAFNGAGVEFLAEPYAPPWGGHRCFAVDPDGNLIELEEPV